MDWAAFLTDHDIPFVTRGPNTKRGELSVQCPFCGDDDQSQHMGIALTSENWGCLRSAQHRGHAPYRLVAALLGCSVPQARLVVRQFSSPDPEGLDGALAALQALSPSTIPHQISPELARTHLTKAEPTSAHHTIWGDFSHIRQIGSTARFWNYLKNRGFDDVDDLVAQYGLKCASTGQWKDRVIIPFHRSGELVGWTGRAIQSTIAAPRYLSSSSIVKSMVFNEDALKSGGRILYIVEGPFDCLKFDYYGTPLGARAGCISGISMTMDQIYTLVQLRRRFEQVVILLDRGAIEPTFDALDWLQGPNVTFNILPEAFKDPGAMTREEVEAFVGG